MWSMRNSGSNALPLFSSSGSWLMILNMLLHSFYVKSTQNSHLFYFGIYNMTLGKGAHSIQSEMHMCVWCVPRHWNWPKRKCFFCIFIYPFRFVWNAWLRGSAIIPTLGMNESSECKTKKLARLNRFICKIVFPLIRTEWEQYVKLVFFFRRP